MSRTSKIARAWTDRRFRAKLSPDELASLPPNPAGSSEGEDDLAGVMGAWTLTAGCNTIGCGTYCWTEDISVTCSGTCDCDTLPGYTCPV